MVTCRILVTGGTGFFGRILVRALVTAGHLVRVISRSAALSVDEGVSIYRGDITRLEDLKSAVRGCSVVFHCAAETTDPARMTQTNVLGTRLLCNVAIDARVKFFCHLSSVGVVGRVRQNVVDESAPCRPMNLYEETKLAAEGVVSTGLDGGNVVILRPTNIFGAQTLLRWLDGSLQSKLRLLLRGNENAHLVYIEDVAAAAIFLWQTATDKRVETFNISSDEELGGTYRQVQALLASMVDRVPRPSAVSAPLFIPYCLRRIRHGIANYGDVIYSSRKLRDVGFKFPFGRRAGLVRVAEALRDPTPIPHAAYEHVQSSISQDK